MNVTDAPQAHDLYDSDRPWLRDEKDDPSKANWMNEFGNPGGKTRPPVFLRGQMMLAIVRTGVLVITLGLAGANPWIAALSCFAGLSVLLGASLVSHVRRLHDAGKPALLALILAGPLLLSFGTGLLKVGQIPETMEKAQLAKLTKPVAEADKPTDMTEKTQVPETKARPQRRGPPREMTHEALLGDAVSSTAMQFFLLSFLTAAFSLLYVARQPVLDETSGRTVR